MKAQNQPSPFHQPFLPNTQFPDHQQPQCVIVLPAYPHQRHRLFQKSTRRRLSCFAISSLFFIAAAYLLWPSDPELSVVRIDLNGLKFNTRSIVSLDINLDLTVRVRNMDFYSVDYDSLVVAVGYRGKRLGFVSSESGHIKARENSYVSAKLVLDGVEVLSDVILLLEDLAKGTIAFDTVSEMSGKLGLFLFDLPVKTKISCEMMVNTHTETISHQNCYPEVSQVR